MTPRESGLGAGEERELAAEVDTKTAKLSESSPRAKPICGGIGVLMAVAALYERRFPASAVMDRRDSLLASAAAAWPSGSPRRRAWAGNPRRRGRRNAAGFPSRCIRS